MKNPIRFFLLVLLLLMASVSAQSRENAGEGRSARGDEKGNGGGGIQEAGEVMTFGSARLFVDPEPQRETQIPGLMLAIATVRNLPLFYMHKDSFLDKFLPYGARKYLKVLSIEPQALRKLKQKYAKLAKKSENSITIFAVTDIETSTTYLLPAFYQLNTKEQAAILFHETCWLKIPSLRYEDVIRAEVAFQRYLEAQEIGAYDSKLGVELSKIFGDYAIALNMDLQFDLKAGNLRSLGATESGFPAFSLVPPKWRSMQCHDTKRENGESECNYFSMGHNPFNSHLYDLSLQNPKSYLLKRLLDFMAPDSRGGIGFLMWYVGSRTIGESESASDHRGELIREFTGCHGPEPKDCIEYGLSDFELWTTDIKGNRSLTVRTY